MNKNITSKLLALALIIGLIIIISGQSISQADSVLDDPDKSYRMERKLVDYNKKKLNIESHKNSHTGIVKDKNLILIETQKLDEDDLDKLGGYKFSNIYANMSSKSRRQEDFSVLYGFYPHHLENSFKVYDLEGLGIFELVQKNGYKIADDYYDLDKDKSFYYGKTDKVHTLYEKIKKDHPDSLVCIYEKTSGPVKIENLQSMKVDLIIDYGQEEENLEVLGGQVDILETLSNLLGFKNKVFNLGIDLLDPKMAKHNYVIPFTYDYKGSFITSDGISISQVNKDPSVHGNLEDLDTDDLAKRVRFDIDSSHGILNHSLVQTFEDFDTDYLEALEADRLIMHAGGAIEAIDYLNTIDALDESYAKGRRLMEIDFKMTTDMEPVGMHSWQGFMWKFFNQDYDAEEFSYDEFMDLESVYGHRQIDLDRLAKWLEGHPDAKIITDIKEGNIRVLARIQRSYPQIVQQIIPQVYSQDEFYAVRALGYEDIVYTLYMSGDKAQDIIDFSKKEDIYGVTIEEARYLEEFAKRVKEIDSKVYINTINDLDKVKEYRDQGVYGVYTDIL